MRELLSGGSSSGSMTPIIKIEGLVEYTSDGYSLWFKPISFYRRYCHMIDRPEQWSAERIFGLDLSKKTFQGCMLLHEEQYAKTHRLSGEMTPEGRDKFISSLRKGDWVAIEGGTSSATFARTIQKNSEAQVFMLNPGELKIIFKTSCKSDRKDAVKIANYMRNCHPSDWVLIPIPTDEESEMRSLVTNQVYLKETRTQHINKLHALFNQAGYPHLKKSDLNDAGRRYDLICHYFPAGSTFRSIANITNDLINQAELAEEAVEDKIREDIILAHPELSLPWLSIPGVGLLTAAACIAFIGNGERFASPAQVRNYVGLVPKQDQSGEKDVQKGINTYGCKPIRRNIIQGAWRTSLLANTCQITNMWVQMAPKNRRKIAVAVADKILSIGWTLIRRGELYRGCSDYAYLKRKLMTYKITAINTSMFPELA